VKRRARGFSLLEVLVAVAIFAVLSALAYGALDAVVRARAQAQDAARALAALQVAVGALERDLREAAARPVRGASGERLPALVGTSTAVELSHAAFASLANEASARLGRSGWALAGTQLRRARWPVLDRAPRSEPVARDLLDGVRSLRLRYLDADGDWRDSWPPRDGPDAQPDRLPRAVEFSLAGEAFGEIVRRVALVAPAEAEPAP
jgi:general secretion pathway protein J